MHISERGTGSVHISYYFKEKYCSLKLGEKKLCLPVFVMEFIIKFHSGSKHSFGKRGLALMVPI